MGHEHHEPGKHGAEHGDRHHQLQRLLGLEHVEHHGHGHAQAGDGNRAQRHAAFAELAQTLGGIAAAREAEHHARGDVELAVHGRQRGQQHHEVEGRGSAGDLQNFHHLDERALVRSRMAPGYDGQHQCQRQEIEQHQAQHRGAEGAGHGLLGVLGFAGRNGNGFQAQIAEDGHDHAHPGAPPAVGEEAAIDKVVVETHALGSGAEDHIGSDQDEGHDGNHLDHGEPVLDLAEGLDAGGIDGGQQDREQRHPDPWVHRGEPVGHVLAHGRDLHAHGQHHGSPVGIAHHKAGQRTDVVLGVGAEGARGGVGHGHLGQASHEQQTDEGADGVADEHAGAGKADGKGAAHEETGTDGATDGDHGHLGRVQVLLQACLALLNTVKVGHC